MFEATLDSRAGPYLKKQENKKQEVKQNKKNAFVLHLNCLG